MKPTLLTHVGVVFLGLPPRAVTQGQGPLTLTLTVLQEVLGTGQVQILMVPPELVSKPMAPSLSVTSS